MNLKHFKRLEAESMHIMRELIAEFSNPTILYSLGKDNLVMLPILQKAFYLAPPLLLLVHVDTIWKFKEISTDSLELKDIVKCTQSLDRQIAIDPYNDNRDIGSFIG